MEDTYREPESLKSDEFKKLKPAKEELLLDSSNTNAVKGVQSFLNSEGYTDKNNETLWVDGRYGANTANAVMKYQRANGLTVDGIVGDETWNSIYSKKKQKEEDAFFKEAIENNRKTENYNNGDTSKQKREEDKIFEIMRNDVWGVPVSKHNNTGYNPEFEVPGIKTTTTKNSVKQTTGMDAHFNSIPDFVPKTEEKEAKAETENFFPERSYNAFENYEAPEEKGETAAKKEGILKPGLNAEGQWSEDPDADNYGKDSAKYKLLKVFDKAYDIADFTGKRNLSAISINLRDFDVESIDKAYYLNNMFGAGWQGHAAILLINQQGEGIMFSYGAATSDFIDGPARMNIGIYSQKAIEDLLKNKEIFVVSDSGIIKKEKYGRYTDYTISVEDGLKMFTKATEMTAYMNEYNVLTNNCDQVTTEIFKAGGVNIFSFIRPNWTYDWESTIDFVRDLAKGE